MSDLIRREDAIIAVCLSTTRDSATDTIKELPSAEPKVAEWEQIEVFEVEGTVIDRLQSTYCPVCHTYHTTPYVYSYNHYDYCPNCGTKMERRTK